MWPTCGASRMSACMASGMPRCICRPLSTPPMRLPRPPARMRPVMSSLAMAMLAADVMHFDAPFAARGIGRHGTAQLRVAVVAALPDVADGRGDLFVGAAAAQQRAQVVAAGGEQAQEQLAFGGQARAVAVVAERLRDARDDADLAAAVGVAPALGRLAGAAGIDRL